MEFHQVVIIGAGPAGLKCAEVLGASGFDVLLLEKNEVIGPKICAGGLTKKAVQYLNLPDDLIDFQSDEIKLHVNNKYSLIKHGSAFVYTINRGKLGHWQLEKLRKFPNVKIETNSFVSAIGKNYLIAGNRKIKYDFLVGADGSLSVVRQYLGIASKRIGPAVQYLIPPGKYQDFELFFNSKLFSAWYAWIFPHDNFVSIGCGCEPNLLSSKNLMKNFNVWLAKNKIDVSQTKFEAFSINYDYQGYDFGNIFLAGDAGGFASEFTGEGIYQALVTGEEIARKIINPDYKPAQIEELLRIKKIHHSILSLLVKAGSFRTIIFHIGRLLFKTAYFRKKAIAILG